MSRTQWYCLAAVLAVVLGLFGTPAVAAGPHQATVAAAAADEDTAASDVPGCDPDRSHPGAGPALPVRNRVPHDPAPGHAAPGPGPALGRAPLPAAARIAVRAARTAAPTPVELSVLRV
ncbi:hypothetical protein [Streptomyces flavovirens]